MKYIILILAIILTGCTQEIQNISNPKNDILNQIKAIEGEKISREQRIKEELKKKKECEEYIGEVTGKEYKCRLSFSMCECVLEGQYYFHDNIIEFNLAKN